MASQGEGKKPSIEVQAGKTLYSEGDEGGAAFYIVSGKVEIFTGSGNSKVSLATLGPGDVFGEMALIDGKPRSASARTIEKTVINPILAERIRTLMDNANPAVRCFIETMAERLRKANEKLMELAPEAVEDDRPVD